MTETRKGASKAVPRSQDTDLNELRTALSRMQEDITRLQSGLSDHAKVRRHVEEAWEAIKQLQKYRDEDNNSLAIVVDDIAQRHEELIDHLTSVHKELEEAIRQGRIRSDSNYATVSEEKLYSFIGIEAPRETWMNILKFVAGLAVLAAGAYVVYRHMSTKDKMKGGSNVVVM